MFISFPTALKIRSITWALDRPSTVNRSTYTGKRSVAVNPWHGRFTARAELVPMVGEAAVRAWRSFMGRCKGAISTFRVYATESAQNANVMVTVAADAAAGATSLTLSGYTTALLDGQMITVNGQLLQLTADQVGAVVTFEPPLRKAAATGTVAVTSRPYALVAMSGSQLGWSVDPGTLYGASFDVEEAILEPDGPPPEAYRQIANRCYVPNKLAGSATSAMSRTAHFARDDISSLKLVFANWYVETAVAGVETGSGGTKTIEASIEYPAGTFTRVTFAGVNVGNIADLANIVSDSVAVTIPNGALFYVRSYIVCQGSGKIVYSGVASAGSILYTGGAGEQPAGSNKVLGGTVTGTTPVYPAAIIGLTAKRAVFVAGDSRAFGETGDATMGDTGEIAPSIKVGVINGGVPTDRMAWFKVNSALRRQIAAYCSDVVLQYGINDFKLGAATAASLEADTLAVCALLASKNVYQSTIEPYGTSIDNWATLGNQTVSTINTQRSAFNDWVRSTPSPLAGYFDVADVLENSRNDGKWKVNGTAFYLTNEGLHPNQTGYTLVRDSVAVSGFA